MSNTDTAIHIESRDRYLTYALSVVSGRALPDVRDGLKPVQRRILYAMKELLGLVPEKNHSKSASVVGEVLAKLHPHGDSACYEAMVRMAQDFSLRYPLVDGQGNFGSLDGDSPAAYRYTEAKLRHLAIEVLGEIDDETVLFRDNFSSTLQEPVVLPSRVPNLLINGASGIAVGMATSIPPHNIKDTIKALLELLDDPELSNAKLASTIKAPDFPTGCMILNSRKELSEMYTTGRGSIKMRGEWKIEEAQRGKQLIVITSIPYAINKSQLVEKIADLILQRKIPQLHDVRDESTDIVRVVLEVTPGASAEAAMAYLFKNTTLESNFSVNLTALVPSQNGSVKPELLSLKAALQHFLSFREEVTQNRLKFERKKLLERIHILEGLALIYDKLDEALKIIRKSEGRTDAASKLRDRFKLSEIQSFAVVDMRVYQLSKTNMDEIQGELKAKSGRVKEIDAILKDRKKLLKIIKDELEALSEKYGDKRRSRLDTDSVATEFNAEDYVVHEDIFAIITKDGWIKRIRQNNDLSGTRLREGDSIFAAIECNTKDSIVLLTSKGNIFSVMANDFPASSGYGEPIQKTLKFGDGEQIVACYSSALVRDGSRLALCSKNGVGYLLTISEVESLKKSGRRVMRLKDSDQLTAVSIVNLDSKELCLITKSGYGLRIKIKDVLPREAPAVGVQLISVKDGDNLCAALSLSSNTELQIVNSQGKEKNILSKEIASGARASRGSKILARDEISSVTIKESEKKSKQLSL
jgi:DNA gyrase subunit A